MNRYQLFYENTFLSNTKLMIAVASENCSPIEIRKLLSEDASMLNQRNIAGDTPLHYAISHGYSMENVLELLKQGAIVENAHFNTKPLHVAAERACPHQYAVLKVLLEYGAHVDKRDYHDHTPLRMLVKTMKRSYQEQSIHLLLSNGANVNALDSENINILKAALMNPRITINAVKMLLEFGANANDCIGYTVTSLPLAKLLLQYVLIKRIANTGFTVLPHKLLDLKFCECLRYYEELVEYRDKCAMELKSMNHEKLNKCHTLFSYINNRCSTAKLNENDLKTSLTLKVLLKLNKYPYCKDLIFASLKEKCVLKEVCNTDIYVWRNDVSVNFSRNYKVSLNGDTKKALTAYLSRSDLINLFVAYNSNQQFNHSESSTKGTKRTHCESDFEQPMKCLKILYI